MSESTGHSGPGSSTTPTLATVLFDLALSFWRLVLRIFFRSIRPRGAWHIPSANSGTAVLFAGAPHHNQFLDPLLLSSEAFRASGRRVSFLTAEKSLRRKFIGPAARMMNSISVVRAADLAKPGIGRIVWSHGSDDDKLHITGLATRFRHQLEPRAQLVLPKTYGSAAAEVAEIISDTECILKRPFKDVPNKLPVNQALAPPSAHTTRISVAEAEPLPHRTSNLSGTEFVVFPHIDHSRMYAQVFSKLNEGGSLGIFPEGGSHDRTDLLPLKRGVVIMALGAMEANPKLKVQIVPVGLSYFHPHKFRSRAVVEFGHPIDVPADLVRLFAQGGDKKRKAVESMMDIVFDGIKSVTVRTPDYETLQLVQAARRLYVPPGLAYGSREETMLDWEAEQRHGIVKNDMAPSAHAHLTLGQVVDLNRRFILGYLRFQDDRRVQRFKASVLAYNRRLTDLGLRDHQVEVAQQANWSVAGLLMYRVILLLVWGSLALPGFILNVPIFVVARIISHRKAQEALAASQVKLQGRDVLATWKVLVSLGMAPILYAVYSAILAYYMHTWQHLPQAQAWWLALLSALVAMPFLAYSTIKFGEAGMDIYKSLPPLILSLLPGHGSQIESLQHTRRTLAKDLQLLIDELAPQIWPDYADYKESMLKRTRPHYADESTVTASKDHINSTPPCASHIQRPFEEAPPGAWMDDEELFGWSASRRPPGLQRIRSPLHSPFLPPQSPPPFSAFTEHSAAPAAPDPPEMVFPFRKNAEDDGPPQDEAEYAAAMDLVTSEVGSYASTLTLAAQAEVQAKAQPESAKLGPSLEKARNSFSQSLSRLFPANKPAPKHAGKAAANTVWDVNEGSSTQGPAQDSAVDLVEGESAAKSSATATDLSGLGRDSSTVRRPRMRVRSHTLEEDISASELRARYLDPHPAPADLAGPAAAENANLASVPFDQAAHVLEGHKSAAQSDATAKGPFEGGPTLPPLRAIPKLDDIPQASRTPSRSASPAFLHL